MKRIFFTGLIILSVAACTQPAPPSAVGADRDAHNCIGSAGYTWSQTRQSCLRVWEEGFALFDTQDKNASTAAFVLVNDNYMQMEVFLPTQPGFVLVQSGQNHDEWAAAGQPWKLVHTDGAWQLLENGRVRYQGHPIQAD